MSAYENAEALADKVTWEGGASEFIWGYGIKLEDLPELPPHVREAFEWLIRNSEAGDFLRDIDDWAEENGSE